MRFLFSPFPSVVLFAALFACQLPSQKPAERRKGGSHVSRYRTYDFVQFKGSSYWQMLGEKKRELLEIMAFIYPFETNDHALAHLPWDWLRWLSNEERYRFFEDDPLARMILHHENMLKPKDLEALQKAREAGDRESMLAIRKRIACEANTHPAEQRQNVPEWQGEQVVGTQHKYDETMLIFPKGGQWCGQYCTFCYRGGATDEAEEGGQWYAGSQRVNEETAFLFDYREPGALENLVEYIATEKRVTGLLFTGGDALRTPAHELRAILEKILGDPRCTHIVDVRLGTKQLTWGPDLVLPKPSGTNKDSIYQLIKDIETGKLNPDPHAEGYVDNPVCVGALKRNVTVVAHINHPDEMLVPEFREAVGVLKSLEVEIRTQTPLLRKINDNPEVLALLWKRARSLKIIPYYLLAERQVSPGFSVPLLEGEEIMRKAFSMVGGLEHSVQGLSLSTINGKFLIVGRKSQTLNGRVVLVGIYVQARDKSWIRVAIEAYAAEDDRWLDDLEPVNPADAFFFDKEVVRPGEDFTTFVNP